jgi:3-phenylpropionate/cinnamic acid dioxygenase small subunit
MDGNSESAPNTVIRTAMEVGPPKVRQRSTSGYYASSYNFIMTKAQLDTLMTFYVTTCAGGALDFEYTHPRLATTQNMRFIAPPSWNKITSTIYRVSIQLEMLP